VVDDARTRVAGSADADVVARTLRVFNAEFGEAAPEQDWLAGRVAELIRGGDTAVMLLETDAEPSETADGIALMRFRPSLWEAADECYLAELYVRPDLRGRGLGRRLLAAAMRHASVRGATYMDVTTTNRDTAAVALYESMGFDRHERHGPDTVSYYFEIDLPGDLPPHA
jgi:ribosomal protein S18 acetylase RimI-like enzyme